MYCSFYSLWVTGLGPVDILTGGVEGTFCAHQTASKTIQCLDHKTNNIHTLSTTPSNFTLQHIRDVQPGEGYACAIGALSTLEPTAAPTVPPTQSPTPQPTLPTLSPTPAPTKVPTQVPTNPPTKEALSEGEIIGIVCGVLAIPVAYGLWKMSRKCFISDQTPELAEQRVSLLM
ncbi:MAG: hypothetical protein CL678_16490 [Bdellovibrionaceae bacterium]|nr:hypothetical protein [Pseudobdellovibrionaceae bacterium]